MTQVPSSLRFSAASSSAVRIPCSRSSSSSLSCATGDDAGSAGRASAVPAIARRRKILCALNNSLSLQLGSSSSLSSIFSDERS